MASLRGLVLPASRNARTIPHRFLAAQTSHPKFSYPTKIPMGTSSVHIPANRNDPTPTPASKPKLKPPRQPINPPPPRHEVQERTESLNIPGFNVPGGGGGPGPGGTSIFQITRSPLFDAALTTIVGLGMSEYCYPRMCVPCLNDQRVNLDISICRGYRLCEVVQEKRPRQGGPLYPCPSLKA
jgi:hypothetical protein